MDCFQFVYGVHDLRNLLLLWEASPHDPGPGGLFPNLAKHLKKVESRQEKLLQLLHLPEDNRQVSLLENQIDGVAGENVERRPTKTTFSGDGFDSPTTHSHLG